MGSQKDIIEVTLGKKIEPSEWVEMNISPTSSWLLILFGDSPDVLQLLCVLTSFIIATFFLFVCFFRRILIVKSRRTSTSGKSL